MSKVFKYIHTSYYIIKYNIGTYLTVRMSMIELIDICYIYMDMKRI